MLPRQSSSTTNTPFLYNFLPRFISILNRSTFPSKRISSVLGLVVTVISSSSCNTVCLSRSNSKQFSGLIAMLLLVQFAKLFNRKHFEGAGGRHKGDSVSVPTRFVSIKSKSRIPRINVVHVDTRLEHAATTNNSHPLFSNQEWTLSVWFRCHWAAIST